MAINSTKLGIPGKITVSGNIGTLIKSLPGATTKICAPTNIAVIGNNVKVWQ